MNLGKVYHAVKLKDFGVCFKITLHIKSKLGDMPAVLEGLHRGLDSIEKTLTEFGVKAKTEVIADMESMSVSMPEVVE